MAYNNYGNRGGYNNYGNRGGYQQNNYGGNNNYQQQPQQVPQQDVPLPIKTPEEFFSQRLDTYLAAIELIKARGLDPSEFAFCLGGWVTSYVIEKEKNEYLNALKEAKSQFFKRNNI